MRAKDVLLKAAELIEQRGLARETFQDSSGSLCILGALRMVCHGDATAHMAHAAGWRAVRALHEELGDEGITAFNDRSTEEEVLAFLRRTAETFHEC